MRINHLVPVTAAAMSALLLLPANAAQAARPVTQITDVTAECLTSGYWSVTMSFTYQGRVEARIYSGTSTNYIDSDHGWVGNGANSWTGSVIGGTNVTVTAHLLKKDGRTHSLVDATTPVTWGPGTCLPG